LQKLVVLSLVEMGQIIDVFAPINASIQLNCFVESDLLVRTRLKVWWMVRHTNVVLCKHGRVMILWESFISFHCNHFHFALSTR